MKKLIVILLLLCVSFTLHAKDFILTEKMINEIKIIDGLYEKYNTIKAKFIQKDNLGNRGEGWFIISKPGKARIEYSNIPVRFIANKGALLYQDTSLKQKTFLPIHSSPFAYLLEDKTSFLNAHIKIMNYVSYSTHVEITMVSKNNPEIGSLTLYLTSEKAEIIKWNVVDAKGIVTEVFLLEPTFSVNGVKNQSIFNTQKIKNVQFANL